MMELVAKWQGKKMYIEEVLIAKILNEAISLKRVFKTVSDIALSLNTSGL